MPPVIHSFTSLFRAGINMHNYSILAACTKVKTIGKMPKDLLQVVSKGDKAKYSSEIGNYLNQSFKDTVKILKEMETVEKQAFKRVPATNSKYLDIVHTAKTTKKPSLQDLLKFEDDVFRERQTECLLQAEDLLMKKLSAVIPDLKNVILTPLGEGNFKQAYKLSFEFNTSGKKVAPMVLGVFRDETLSVSIAELNIKFMRNISNKTLADTEQVSINLAKKGRRIFLRKQHKMLKSAKSQNYGKYGHGAYAEANNTEYLRYMSGHRVTPKDGIVLSDFYCLEEDTPFVISKYIGKSESAEHAFDFASLGLSHEDFNINPNNDISGICIDLGGIVPTSMAKKEKASSIVGNKLGTRISKQFSRLKTKEEREKYLEELIDSSSKQKNLLDRKDTLNAVEEILGTRLNEIY